MYDINKRTLHTLIHCKRKYLSFQTEIHTQTHTHTLIQLGRFTDQSRRKRRRATKTASPPNLTTRKLKNKCRHTQKCMYTIYRVYLQCILCPFELLRESEKCVCTLHKHIGYDKHVVYSSKNASKNEDRKKRNASLVSASLQTIIFKLFYFTETKKRIKWLEWKKSARPNLLHIWIELNVQIKS